MPSNYNMVVSAHELAALLDWYEAAGADCAISDGPQDRFEETRLQIEARKQAKSRSDTTSFPSQNSASRARPSPDRSHRERHEASFSASDNTFTSKSPSNQGPLSPQPQMQGSSQAYPNQNQGQAPHERGNGPALANRTGSALVEEARLRAAEAPTLQDLRQALADFDGCSLKLSAKSLVFGDGNPDADVMFIGEAPGRDEDLSGLPFVGRAGQLLDKMMQAIQRDRTNSYITNILPWRPPGNRKPSLDESVMLRPFIHRHIELVDPKVLVFLGGTAAQQLLDSKDGIMRLRGRWKSYAITMPNGEERAIPAMATLHPAFLLRTPAQKRSAWQDFLDIAAKLDTL